MRPAYDDPFINGKSYKPRMLVLEVRDPNNLEKDPVGRVLVERSEIATFHEGAIYESTIEMHYRLIAGGDTRDGINRQDRGSFVAHYSSLNQLTSLTSSSIGNGGAIFLDLPRLKGHRVGTYLFNEIVLWAQRQGNPDAGVRTISLLEGQAGASNKDRRNRFYEQFGIHFDYADVDHKAGTSRPMVVAQLVPLPLIPANIEELHLFDYLGDLVTREETASREVSFLKRANKELHAERRAAAAKPLRWTLKNWLGIF
jgi:GNAT superfamily N-acetyltransferase